MNLRVVTLVIGLFILGNGIFGLTYPERLMPLMGLAPSTPAEPAAALGEIRAVYGGVLSMTGVWLLLASLSLQRYRISVLLIGLLWLSGCTGRLLGVLVFGDGNPGPWGWLAAAVELVVGVALVLIWRSSHETREARGAAPVTTPTPG